MKRVNHDVVSLHWMTDILGYCLPAMGYDPADVNAVYKLSFADAPFAGYQIALRRDDPAKSRYYGKSNNLYGTYYQVSEVVMKAAALVGKGARDWESANGFVHEVITGYFATPPEHLYLRIETTTAAIFVD